MLRIPFSSIEVGERYRDPSKYGDLAGLANSLTSVGSIHPIALSMHWKIDGQAGFDTFTEEAIQENLDAGNIVMRLVAGGRRYAAMQKLGTQFLYHKSILNPNQLGFNFANEVPEDLRREAELDENLYRLNTSWIENCLAVADIHRLKKARDPKWGIRQTAQILGQTSHMSTNYAINIAKKLRAGDKELAECENMSAAIALCLKRKEDEMLANMQQQAGGPVATILPGSSMTASFLDQINKTIAPNAKPAKLEDALAELGLETPVVENLPTTELQSAPVPPAQPPRDIPLSKMFTLGDSVKDIMPQIPDCSFDHIVTDIPYGIDMENLKGMKGLEDVEKEHEVEFNVAQMPEFLRQAFRILKPKGFCVFFYDLDHHEKLQTWAEEAGFKVQRWPLFWVKTHNCKNQAAAYNTTKDYEVAMMLRKDSETVLRHPVLHSVFTCDGSATRRLYNNPFAKPFELWKWIYDMIAFPGQKVYDPFCGEMSACKAAADFGLAPFGSEVSEKHFARGLENMKAAYALIYKSNCTFS